MKVSFIATVFNEEKTIKKFLASLLAQTKQPEEIIIVDGGSVDNTVAEIKNAKGKKIKIFVSFGANRSQGRNLAIKKAGGEIIVTADGGCELDKKWLEEITKPFKNPTIDVVAGYYQPITKNTFQKCLACYTCVMKDQINPQDFLPSSRSILKNSFLLI